MTPERIKELKEMCEKVVPGPWWSNGFSVESSQVVIGEFFSTTSILADRPTYVATDTTDFIAASRTALPEALLEIERLREALAFYADTLTHQAHGPVSPIGLRSVPIYTDRGQRARKALEGEVFTPEQEKDIADFLEENKGLMSKLD